MTQKLFLTIISVVLDLSRISQKSQLNETLNSTDLKILWLKKEKVIGKHGFQEFQMNQYNSVKFVKEVKESKSAQ